MIKPQWPSSPADGHLADSAVDKGTVGWKLISKPQSWKLPVSRDIQVTSLFFYLSPKIFECKLYYFVLY